MPLRKLLVYGGCHALVLRDLLTSLAPHDVEATLLVNFELIRLGQSFPYDTLSRYDCVFYSPIENKAEYNTSHVAEACRAKGIDAFCFPWLEWHGYSPDAAKGSFKQRFQWRYNGLAHAAEAFEDFEAFFDWAVASYPDDGTIDATFEASTERLRAAEDRYDMPIRAADFILENHQKSRLFLIPDHPSILLYLHVARQMLALLGLPMPIRSEVLLDEPQWRWRTPIFPRVAKRLKLDFHDPIWIDDEVVPGCKFDLRSYLRLYFHRDSIILAPKEPTYVWPRSFDLCGRKVEATTRLVADRMGGHADGCRADEARAEYRLIEVLSGEGLPIGQNQYFEIVEQQWRTSWGA